MSELSRKADAKKSNSVFLMHVRVRVCAKQQGSCMHMHDVSRSGALDRAQLHYNNMVLHCIACCLLLCTPTTAVPYRTEPNRTVGLFLFKSRMDGFLTKHFASQL